MEGLEYLKKEGVIALFANLNEGGMEVFDAVSGELNTPFPIQFTDLANIHKLIRSRKCFTVMEFGVGFSTIVIADALRKNKLDWEALPNQPKVRNRFMFKSFSVDASQKWIEKVKSDFPAELKDIVNFQYSGVSIGTFNGQLCHYYDELPDVIADFIYIDAPHPKDVKGKVNGMSFQCDERTVMSGDVLLMEPILLPGTCILFDGRTNNVRFVRNNLKRNYSFTWDKDSDQSILILEEERLGKYNILGSDFF